MARITCSRYDFGSYPFRDSRKTEFFSNCCGMRQRLRLQERHR